ncbi:MAG: hypothetical protein PUD44_07415 [Clostridiaceae bacterium]|nr:hypothetical protein [Clostridiaceae bacterium]MDY3072915.1 hypothetical protein [Eubacteriales bacterium]
MDWSRAKNIVIGMLVLVNLFLLATLGYLKYTEASNFRESVNGTVRVLKSRGIEVDESLIVKLRDDRRLCVVVRSRETEADVAAAFLGETELSGSGGSDRYRSGSGTLSWLPGGIFSASFRADAASLREKLASLPLSDTASVSSDGGTLCQYIDGYPVFNCTVGYAFGTDGSCTLSGRVCLGEPQPASDAEPMGLCGVLIDYASIVSGLAIERIDAIDPGWVAQTLPGAGVRLVPVWRITGSGVVTYVNALDGSAVLAE